MEAPAQLGIYAAVLRKHVPLLAVSALVVVTAGVVYVLRQQPVFMSSATLLIERPARNVQTPSEFADRMQEDFEELNTQVRLLREKKQLSEKAIAALVEAHPEAAAAGYREDALRRSVKVEPIPGTRAWTFSLTGSDSATLHHAVNAYATVFQEWSEGKSATLMDSQEIQFRNAVDESEAKLKVLEAEAKRIVDANQGINVSSGPNVKAEELQSLRRPAELDDERAALENALEAIVTALARAGYEVERGADAAVRVAARAGSAPLVEDEHVAALQCVRSNDVIRNLLQKERDALEREERLKAADFKPDKEERVAARKEAEGARSLRGTKIANVIQDALYAIDRDLERNAKMSKYVAEVKAEAAKAEIVRQAYDEVRTKIRTAEREVDRATSDFKSFKAAWLPEAGAEGRRSRATRRIILETPAAGSEQIAPKVPLIIGLTAFAAIAVGLGLVLLMEYLDDTVKSKEDFDRWVALPFLGFIPRIETKDTDRPDLAADARTGSAIAEAFRAVRTSILFSRSGKPVRRILVTSAGPGEGKTTIASNLAVTLAKHKAPVLLVDADLRRPRVAKALGIENKVGLTNYLIGELSLDEVIQKTSVEGLYALTSGPVPPNPAELLHGDQLAAMLEKGLERFDRIVIDSPPLIAVSDARVIARCTDGLYLVISMGKTSRRLIQRSLESLTSIGFSVHGAILNNVSAPTGRYGYYYYRDYNYGKSYYVQQPPATPGA